MIELNPDEQEAAADIRMMKRLQVELDSFCGKLAVIHGCAERTARHCDEHAGKLPDHPTSLLKPMLSGIAHSE